MHCALYPHLCLNEIVLGELNKLLTMVSENEDEFIQTCYE